MWNKLQYHRRESRRGKRPGAAPMEGVHSALWTTATRAQNEVTICECGLLFSNSTLSANSKYHCFRPWENCFFQDPLSPRCKSPTIPSCPGTDIPLNYITRLLPRLSWACMFYLTAAIKHALIWFGAFAAIKNRFFPLVSLYESAHQAGIIIIIMKIVIANIGWLLNLCPALCWTLYLILHLMTIIGPWGGCYYYSHFMIVEMEARKSSMTELGLQCRLCNSKCPFA